MRSAQLFVLAIAAATAAANVLTDGVTTAPDASTALHISVSIESGLSSSEHVTVPVVSPSATQSPSLTDSKSRTDVDAVTTDDASVSSTGVTRPAGFPNATTTLASSVVPTKSQNTTTPTSHVTGGAIPQQMQSSMAGLIGFCIMGLIML
ncbi:hypothetical protein BBK36DRAFT_1135422 [Trichoderma citrinoviride]|uniref:GPI anchored protein n=1 Tax=Trichoderma citrinoviride TaxID=58853 RepID=A0A2T4BAU2_9HYPO|nr:hypothetical protein BBK36DRAFT_1135422 [Trichoderma citrinoviride]PTB66453.1 hypothetical protein BBK36DRAFT_1135422 [Trichoderma citrinoviride]